jgi:hypothetical protein
MYLHISARFCEDSWTAHPVHLNDNQRKSRYTMSMIPNLDFSAWWTVRQITSMRQLFYLPGTEDSSVNKENCKHQNFIVAEYIANNIIFWKGHIDILISLDAMSFYQGKYDLFGSSLLWQEKTLVADLSYWTQLVIVQLGELWLKRNAP